jgi:hypothetical protein
MKHNTPHPIGLHFLTTVASKSQKSLRRSLRAVFPTLKTRLVALSVFLSLGCAAFYSTSSASPTGILLRGYLSARVSSLKFSGVIVNHRLS